MTVGCTRLFSSSCANPQSVPAIRFSRPDTRGKPEEPLGDQLRMLDHVGAVAHDAWHENLARRELHVLPHLPFVLVARVGRLDAGTRPRSP